MQKVCAERYNAFWSAGNGSKIKTASLDEFAAKYAKGVYPAPKVTVSV